MHTGLQLKKWLCDALDEPDDFFDGDTKSQLTKRNAYRLLDEAAKYFLQITGALQAEVTITTVEDQQAYDLPVDFVRLKMRCPSGCHVIKYYDADADNYLFPRSETYENVYLDNQTVSAETPVSFAVREKQSTEDVLTGNVTSAGAAANGQCTLTDSGKLFTTTNLVYARDSVENVTDGSLGLVLSVTDATSLLTALFGGTDNDWTNSDAYRIYRQNRKQIYLDAPSKTAGDTITVPYIQMVDPVYSERGFWRFSEDVCWGICNRAAASFKASKGDFQEAAVLDAVFSAHAVGRQKVEDFRRGASGRVRREAWLL